MIVLAFLNLLSYDFDRILYQNCARYFCLHNQQHFCILVQLPCNANEDLQFNATFVCNLHVQSSAILIINFVAKEFRELYSSPLYSLLFCEKTTLPDMKLIKIRSIIKCIIRDRTQKRYPRLKLTSRICKNTNNYLNYWDSINL